MSLPYEKNRSTVRTWGLMLSFIPFGWNAVLKYQYLGELNCYKCEGRQVITIFEGKMYSGILFTLSSSLIKAYY